jgi:hypothetical protein
MEQPEEPPPAAAAAPQQPPAHVPIGIALRRLSLYLERRPLLGGGASGAGGAGKCIFRDVTGDVAGGSLFLIIGGSGSGKTRCGARDLERFPPRKAAGPARPAGLRVPTRPHARPLRCARAPVCLTRWRCAWAACATA